MNDEERKGRSYWRCSPLYSAKFLLIIAELFEIQVLFGEKWVPLHR
jgi:hypothetical protein